MRLTTATLVAPALAAATTAQANTIDQSDLGRVPTATTISQDPYLDSPLGQTFVPSLSSIGFSTFQLTNIGGAAQSTQLEVLLFAGIDPGAGGTPLATSDVVTFPGSDSATNIEFNFPTSTPVNAGSAYTLIVRDLTSMDTGAALYEPQSNPYAGGTLIESSTVVANADTVFSEGIRDSSAAPEPGVWALMLGGVGAMGLMLRRRRRASATLAT